MLPRVACCVELVKFCQSQATATIGPVLSERCVGYARRWRRTESPVLKAQSPLVLSRGTDTLFRLSSRLLLCMPYA